MRRGRKPASEAGKPREKMVKTSVKLPRLMKLNMKYMSLEQSLDESDIVREALASLFTRLGIDWMKSPHAVFAKVGGGEITYAVAKKQL